MKADHYTVVLILVSVTVKRLLAVTAEKDASSVKIDKENSLVFHPEESHLLYDSLPLEQSDDKVTVDINLQGNSTVEATNYDTDLEGKEESRSFPISLLNEQEEHALPIVSKEGILYYDIAQVKEVEVVIVKNSRGVEGVTATREHGPCLVQTLVLENGYILDKDIAINCHLKNLTMKGMVFGSILAALYILE